MFMSNSLDGWDLLYKTVEKDIQTKSDVLMTVVHWQLLRAGMKCIGIGEDKNLSPSDEESELLPDGWNINTNSYAMRYKYRNQVFILLGMVVENSLMLKFFNGEFLAVSEAPFVIEPTVMSLKGSLTTLIPEIEPVINRLKELFEPLLSEKKKSSEIQTSPDGGMLQMANRYFAEWWTPLNKIMISVGAMSLSNILVAGRDCKEDVTDCPVGAPRAPCQKCRELFPDRIICIAWCQNAEYMRCVCQHQINTNVCSDLYC